MLYYWNEKMRPVVSQCTEHYFHQNKKQKKVELQVGNDAIDLLVDHQLWLLRWCRSSRLPFVICKQLFLMGYVWYQGGDSYEKG